MKMTSNGSRLIMVKDLKISKVEYLSNHWSDVPQISNLSTGDQSKIKKYIKWRRPLWKTANNGRRPQNNKSWISQQPLIGFLINFKLKLRGPNQNQTCLKQKRPLMEDDHKILKVAYISKCWLDFPQI